MAFLHDDVLDQALHFEKQINFRSLLPLLKDLPGDRHDIFVTALELLPLEDWLHQMTLIAMGFSIEGKQILLKESSKSGVLNDLMQWQWCCLGCWRVWDGSGSGQLRPDSDARTWKGSPRASATTSPYIACR